MAILSVGEDVKQEHLYMTGGNVKWYDHYGKQFGSHLKQQQQTYTYQASHSIPSYLSKRNESICRYKALYMNVQKQFYLPKSKTRNNENVHQQM